MSTEEALTAAIKKQRERYRSWSLATLVMILAAAFGFHARWLFSKPLAELVSQTSVWLQSLSGHRLSAQLLIFGPFLAVLSLVIGFLVKYGLPDVWASVRRSAIVGLLLGACLLAVAMLVSGRLKNLDRAEWLFFVPVVAPVLLGYQALVVWRQRPRSLGRYQLALPSATMEQLRAGGIVDRFERTYQQLLRVFGGPISSGTNIAPGSVQQDKGGARDPSQPALPGEAYHPAYFVTNFAVPGLLLLVIGFAVISMAKTQPSWADDVAWRGLRWGVAGAFVYVFIEFGARFFRNDLTVGAATWAIITLIVGPALAVTLAVAWRMEAGDSPWQTGAVLFFAGLAPRRVVAIVEGTALQLLKAPNEVSTPPKTIPLRSLRGISAEVALRLREENIEDVGSLAYADAIRLVQNLPYDLRQVVDWMDQAQLALVLPNHYEALRERGVTGAIDLAWRWLRVSVKATAKGAVIEPPATAPQSFKDLVIVEKDADLVYETAAQLFYEEQVCLLWVMYNCFSTTAGGADLVSEPASTQPKQEPEPETSSDEAKESR